MIRLLTACLAASALLVTGCGGGDEGASREDYERQVREAGETLERTFGDLGTSISGAGSTEQAAEKLEEGATALDKAAADLEDIEPPSDIEDAHADIVEGLEQLADEFREGAQAAEGGELDQLLSFAQNLENSEAVKQITEAGEKIESEGYDFEGN